MFPAILLLLLLLITICMMLRDGRPYFGDPLKVATAILVVLLCFMSGLLQHFR